MVDFIKIIIKDLSASELVENPLLNFCYEVNPLTAEINTTNSKGDEINPHKKANYKNLTFRIYDSGTITMSGSLHYYYNDGKHNFNDFNLKNLFDVLNDLKSTFGINPKNCIIKSLEIGVNFIPPVSAEILLKNCFLHKKSPFFWSINTSKAKCIKSKHSQYSVKFYDKAIQALSKGDRVFGQRLMRFEIKYSKMQKLNKMGIYTLEDLKNFDFQIFKRELINEFNNILIFDDTIESRNKILDSYNNPLFWQDLAKPCKNRNNFNYHRKRLKEIILRNSEKIQMKTAKIIEEKIDSLL